MMRFGRFRGKRLCVYDHRAAGDAGCDYRAVAAVALFVALGHAIGWPTPRRGMLTIWLAHVTFCTAYVTVVIASRLRELDRSIEEEAAMGSWRGAVGIFCHYVTDDHARGDLGLAVGNTA